jgi:hypothetical protein
MNDINFVSGGITDQNPKLLARISDESGINTVGNGIGHDLTAILDNYSREILILNDYYVADLNTFKSGQITYPLFNLSEGEHRLDVKVWDIYNNSSEASISFIVASSASFALEKLMNFPNPFRDRTTFSFEYNQPYNSMEVEIRIYSFTGNLVKILHQNVFTNGYKVQNIEWDGTADNGMQIGSGTYVYQLQVSLPDGSTVVKSSKLVYIR